MTSIKIYKGIYFVLSRIQYCEELERGGGPVPLFIEIAPPPWMRAPKLKAKLSQMSSRGPAINKAEFNGG